MTHNDSGRTWRGPTTLHLTAFGAYRARRRWMREVRGRDSYVYRAPGLRLRRFKVTRIDYAPPAPAVLVQVDEG